jgi:hypothetical protein
MLLGYNFAISFGTGSEALCSYMAIRDETRSGLSLSQIRTGPDLFGVLVVSFKTEQDPETQTRPVY